MGPQAGSHQALSVSDSDIDGGVSLAADRDGDSPSRTQSPGGGPGAGEPETEALTSRLRHELLPSHCQPLTRSARASMVTQ
jgi:hypothetical protein